MASKRTSGEAETVAKPKRRSAFVSAPFSVDTNVLLRALKERGLETIRIEEMEAGQNIHEWVRKSIDRADYVIAVMGEGRTNENVLFEVGMATAMRKHVLVLTPQEASIPASLLGLTYLRTDPNNREAIEFGLDQLLASPKIKPDIQTTGASETHPIGESADSLLKRLQHLRQSNSTTEADLIALISQAILASGVSALARDPRTDAKRFADIAVWSDDLEPWIGNPLIIEVKKRLIGRKDFQSAIQALSTLLDETRSPRGLLVYMEAKPAILYVSAYDPRIMVLSAQEFIGGLKESGLGDVLRQARNEHVHLGG